MTSVLAILQAIPAIIGLIQELFSYFKQLKAESAEQDVINFILESSMTVRKIKEAKTDEEKKAAARAVHDLIGKL